MRPKWRELNVMLFIHRLLWRITHFTCLMHISATSYMYYVILLLLTEHISAIHNKTELIITLTVVMQLVFFRTSVLKSVSYRQNYLCLFEIDLTLLIILMRRSVWLLLLSPPPCAVTAESYWRKRTVLRAWAHVNALTALMNLSLLPSAWTPSPGDR